MTESKVTFYHGSKANCTPFFLSRSLLGCFQFSKNIESSTIYSLLYLEVKCIENANSPSLVLQSPLGQVERVALERPKN